MKYLNVLTLLIFSVYLSSACTSSSSKAVESYSSEEVADFVRKNLEHGADQYKFLMKNLPENEFPKTYYAAKDQLETSGSRWWTSGFYPGSLLYLYEETGDKALLKEAKRIMASLEKEQYTTSTHDLGFMMYCSFGNLNRLEPKKEYKEILINSAESLASRYNPTVGAIRSWDYSDPEDFLVIIDNMMNLELLFWATKETGDSTYYNIAIDHANTTIANHFRADNSSYHVIEYKTATGEINEKKTAQGYADESAWARGQAWGLYGFTVMFRETKDEKYLKKAEAIADFMLNHPNLPEDKIPYWDFDAPNIPDELRDASAAAITASALLELGGYYSGEKRDEYFDVAETILRNLSEEHYQAKAGENGGFILKHGVGHLPKDSEVDVPLTYADYYYIEALKRYKALRTTEN